MQDLLGIGDYRPGANQDHQYAWSTMIPVRLLWSVLYTSSREIMQVLPFKRKHVESYTQLRMVKLHLELPKSITSVLVGSDANHASVVRFTAFWYWW